MFHSMCVHAGCLKVMHESVVTGQVNVDGPMAELSATFAVLKLNALPKHCVCHHASVSSDNAHW